MPRRQAVHGDSEHQATFHLSKPQPALLALLASGMGPVYPCHREAKDMRLNPVGTGPFKFVEFKSNDSIKLVRNPNYWKPGPPYLDAMRGAVYLACVSYPNWPRRPENNGRKRK